MRGRAQRTWRRRGDSELAESNGSGRRVGQRREQTPSQWERSDWLLGMPRAMPIYGRYRSQVSTTPSQSESLFVLLFVQLEHAQHSWICRQDRSSISLAVHINRITLSYSPASSVRLRTSVGGGNCGQLRDLPRAAYSVTGREAEPQEARAHSSDSTQKRATPKDKELDWARTFPGEGD